MRIFQLTYAQAKDGHRDPLLVQSQQCWTKDAALLGRSWNHQHPRLSLLGQLFIAHNAMYVNYFSKSFIFWCWDQSSECDPSLPHQTRQIAGRGRIANPRILGSRWGTGALPGRCCVIVQILYRGLIACQVHASRMMLLSSPGIVIALARHQWTALTRSTGCRRHFVLLKCTLTVA